MRLLDQYIARAIIYATVIVILVLLGIETFIEFIGQLSSVGTHHYGIKQAFEYVPLEVPTDLYQLFPVAAFVGCLVGLSGLAKYNQLIVMQASGYSIMKIIWAAIKAALIMLVFVTLIGEFVAPKLVAKAEQIYDQAMITDQNDNILPQVWLHHDHDYIYINGLPDWNHLRGFYQFHFNQNLQLDTLIAAKSGERIAGQWILNDLTINHFLANQIVTSKQAHADLNISLKPELLWLSHQDPSQSSVIDLLRLMHYRHQMGLANNEFSYAFWERVIQPITTIVMIVLGVPFLMGSMRTMTMGARLLLGVVIGFGFYLLNQFFGPFSMVFHLPPFFAAAIPTVIFAIACVILLRRFS